MRSEIREIVNILGFVKWEINLQITNFKADNWLSYVCKDLTMAADPVSDATIVWENTPERRIVFMCGTDGIDTVPFNEKWKDTVLNIYKTIS